MVKRSLSSKSQNRTIQPTQKGNRTVQGVPQSQAAAKPWHQRIKINACKINRQMHEKHSPLFPKRVDHNAKWTKNTKTKSEARLNMKWPVVETTKPD